VWFPVIRATSNGAPWVLFLQHRQEPFEATINRVWRSNLVTGGVVLLLLAITMVLVLIASQNAQNLANLQMDFVASISHELRTPLAAILSAGQNISDGYARSLPVYGSIITTQARQLIDLVDQILMFVSMKSGNKAYSVRQLRVSELIDHVRRNTSVLFRNSGCAVDFQIQEGLPPIWGDLQALSHCLQNLIGNAVKYRSLSRSTAASAFLPPRFTVPDSVCRWRSISLRRWAAACPSQARSMWEAFLRYIFGSPKASIQILLPKWQGL